MLVSSFSIVSGRARSSLRSSLDSGLAGFGFGVAGAGLDAALGLAVDAVGVAALGRWRSQSL